MKQLLKVALLYLLSPLVFAETSPSATIEELFTTRDPEKFPALLEKAKQEKIASQTLLEAQFLYYVDARDYTALAKLAPSLQQTEFSSETSEIFTLEDDWLAITSYCQALAALENEDYQHFKELITEAFWHSPRQAAAFAPHIEKLKMRQAMANLTIDLQQSTPNLLDNKSTLLLSKDTTATLLYFWSPWSREFDEAIEDFKLTNKEATEHNFRVISLLAEVGQEVESDAKTFITDQNIKDLSLWVTDTPNHTLAKAFRVQNIPTVILLNPQGKVQFNGHPSDPDLWVEITKISPQFKQPSFPEN